MTNTQPPAECTHGLSFDKEAAEKMLDEWHPETALDLVLGNPQVIAVRRRWPRLDGTCPLGCGFCGIAYASMDHYRAGDW